MDEYTQKTRSWLDDRYRATDASGVYESHAPIYGFVPALQLDIHKYLYRVLKAVRGASRHVEIRTVLDVGCSEGYLAHLVREMLGCHVLGCDLSFEAVKKARRIFGISTFQADAQNLRMLPDGCMDLVLCTETLEHLPDPHQAVAELLRVSRGLVIITVPAASDRGKARFRPSDEPHAHLHVFTRREVEQWFGPFAVSVVGVLNRFLRWDILLNARRANLEGKSRLSIGAYQLLRGAFAPMRRFYGEPLARGLIRVDAALAPRLRTGNMMYMVIASKGTPAALRPLNGDDSDVMNRLFSTAVPPYRPDL